jgi:POT family proton-dependent oligopeptide transporter
MSGHPSSGRTNQTQPSALPLDAPSGHSGEDFETRQPAGLWVLFITEMWERFSYYGMRALFVLFLIASAEQLIPGDLGTTENYNPGFGWSKDDAYTLYGVYTFMVYLTSIFGGMVADRLLGTHRSMLLGGWIIALGHIVLAAMVFFPHELGTAVSASHGYGALMCFLLGCTLIIIGTGFFKPCVSVMVGQLYGKNDPRRDSGFTIFYMGINLGAFLAPLIAGYLGEKVGWHWGFGSAAIGMLLGLFFYQLARGKYLGGIGEPPSGPLSGSDKKLVTISLIVLFGIPLVPLLIFVGGGLDWVTSQWSVFTSSVGLTGMSLLITGVVLFGSLTFLFGQPSKDRGPLAVILILAFIGNIFFWTAFEQAGSSLNVFAKEQTDLTLWGLVKGGIPASFFQSVNPLTILLFGPVFSWLWIFLERKNQDPSTPMKFAIGLWLLGLAFVAMVFGAMDARSGLAGAHWLLLTFLIYTWGELCLSPVGLSMVTKLAPARLQSLMMGLWFFTFALSNLLAGLVARFSERFVPETPGGEAELTFLIPGLPGFFLMLVVLPIVAGVLIAALTPFLKRMMHGAE